MATKMKITKWQLDADPRLIARMVEIAKKQVGVVETPKNSNNGPMIREYQKAGKAARFAPYCTSGIQWCFMTAQLQLRLEGIECAMPILLGKPAVISQLNYAKKYGKLCEGMPALGSLIIWKSPLSFNGHVGIVIGILDEFRYRTLEFNTSPTDAGDQRNGGGVYIKTRDIRKKLGSLTFRGFIEFVV